MNSNEHSSNAERFSDEIIDYNTPSLDEFFKELEAREKALDISPEMVIEIDEVDFNDDELPEFLKAEFSKPPEPPAKSELPKTIPPNNFAPQKDSVSELENRISLLQNQISKMEAERMELAENSRRRSTDFDNYRKRTERERSETFRNQIGNLANQMLPVLDNLDRALDAASNLKNEKAQDFQQFYEGIVLVSQQLNEILAEMGVEPILSVGKAFDPHFHEAVATEESDEFSPHTITAELMRGYRIGEKVIRPSMVKVSCAAK